MRENKIVYLVEGECEMKFIRDLLINIRNKDGILLNGTVHKFNPYQEKNIRKIHRHLAKNKDVIFVLDNDVAINEHFKRNIKDILKISKNVYLLVQNDNFEDELMYMCKLSKHQFLKLFNIASFSEFKTKYISSTNLLKSKVPNMDYNKYCSRCIIIPCTGCKVISLKELLEIMS